MGCIPPSVSVSKAQAWSGSFANADVGGGFPVVPPSRAYTATESAILNHHANISKMGPAGSGTTGNAAINSGRVDVRSAAGIVLSKALSTPRHIPLVQIPIVRNLTR